MSIKIEGKETPTLLVNSLGVYKDEEGVVYVVFDTPNERYSFLLTDGAAQQLANKLQTTELDT